MDVIPPLQKPLEVEIKQTTQVVLEEEEDDEEEDDLTSITESTTDMVIASKKRPSTDIDVVESDDEGIRDRGGTPPKRARLNGTYSPATADEQSPRLRKRSSEELEDGPDVPGEQVSKKRRTSPSSPYAESESIPEEETTSASGGEELDPLVHAPRFLPRF